MSENNFGLMLNKVIEKCNLQLHVMKTRYSDGIIAFLAGDEEPVERIAYCFTAGDSFYEEVRMYFKDAKWYPLVYGETAVDALDKLLNFLDQEFISSDLELWRKAVVRASWDFVSLDFSVPQNRKPIPADLKEYMAGW